MHRSLNISRRSFLSTLAALPLAGAPILRLPVAAQGGDPLPSWNEGPAKQAILEFVRATVDPSSPSYVSPEERLATFDQDGTLWVEHPIYTQVVFALDRVVSLAPQHPEWQTTEPFSTVLAHNQEALGKLSLDDLAAVMLATQTGMSVESFEAIAQEWIAQARHPRWNQLYTDLVYQPMLEVMNFLRSNGFRTYIVTGGGQDFVRTYAERVYGVPPEQVIGSAFETKFSDDADARGVLTRTPKLLLRNNFSGKAEDIYMFTGRRPLAAFGNSTGDRQMLEFTQAGPGARLMMLVLHDDAAREYAYGPAQGLPDTKIGRFPQELYDEAKARAWTVISMKNDWKDIFPPAVARAIK